MSLTTKLHFFIVCAALGMLSHGSIALATTFNGQTELSAQTFKELEINGSARLSEIRANSLTVKGSLDFKRLNVTGDTKVLGACSGEESDFKNLAIQGTFWGAKIRIVNLQVDGEVAIEDFTLNGEVNIKGPLKAKNGSFNNIDAVNAPIALYNVTVNNINVKKDNTNNRNEVKLAGNTVVSGNITFESGEGIVFIRDKTAQLKGKVIGGKIKE